MTSQWDKAITNMFEICWAHRGQLPIPSSCRDYQLYDLYDEMCWQWSMYDDLMKRRDDMDFDEERVILEKLVYYENMIEEIEYEFERRPWLK
jgi:hypothetical protein